MLIVLAGTPPAHAAGTAKITGIAFIDSNVTDLLSVIEPASLPLAELSIRGAQRRNNPEHHIEAALDCFALIPSLSRDARNDERR